MTISQSQAVWELCRQGFPLNADDAAEHWERGETYEPDWQVKVSREIENLIETCNWEIKGDAEIG
ncbi:MAG: hypothetical protein U9Q81_23110 [Pseudomonadota bacterium]|nr:hypothetical protein [Pseudomonadota bacterium]